MTTLVCSHFGTYIIECMNELLKEKVNIISPRHRSMHNFVMNSR